MNISEKTIIGDIVAANYKTAAVFKKAGIDFCCNGNRTIKEACDDKNLSAQNILTEIETQLDATQPIADFNAWSADLLADYIEKKHHRYVTTKISEIKPFLEKLTRVHGKQHPELIAVEQLFNESAGELTTHMKKEELILFPFVRAMVEKETADINKPFQSVLNPIGMMQHEHNTEGDRFRKIASLTNNYTPPEDACNTYKVTFALLREFEEDLHLHIHLENNILFPKAIAMEAARAM